MDVNTAIQRATVKAIGLHGLGLYIYAGEDLPEGDDTPRQQQSRPEPKPTTNNNNGDGGDYVSRMEALLQRVPKGHFYEGFLIDRLAKHQQWDNVRWSDKQIALLSKAEHEFPAAPF
jgi:hypothetical protein